MEENPYASPAVPETAMPQIVTAPRELQVATQGKRFLNLILDGIVIQILSTFTGFVVGAIYGVFFAATHGGVTPEDEATFQVVGFVLGLLVYTAYFIILEGLFQRSLAKLITGTLVVTAGGGRPSFGQIVGRSFARLIPFEAFSFLGGKQPVGWHDSLSGTRVISIR